MTPAAPGAGDGRRGDDPGRLGCRAGRHSEPPTSSWRVSSRQGVSQRVDEMDRFDCERLLRFYEAHVDGGPEGVA